MNDRNDGDSWLRIGTIGTLIGDIEKATLRVPRAQLAASLLARLRLHSFFFIFFITKVT